MILTVLIVVSCGEKTITPDNLEVKEEITYLKGETEPFTGEVIENYEDGKLKSKANYEGGKLNGNYEEYYESGQLRMKANYFHGQFDGNVEAYYENGQKKQSLAYSKGEKDENSILEWFEDGSERLGDKTAENILKKMEQGYLTTKVYGREGNSLSGRSHPFQSDKEYIQNGAMDLSQLETSSRVVQTFSGRGTLTSYKIDISSAGREYLVSQDPTPHTKDKTAYIVKTAEYKFDELVGVFQEKGSLTAEIEYTARLNSTPFFIKRNQQFGVGLSDCLQRLRDEGITQERASQIYDGQIVKRKVQVRKYEGKGWKPYK